MLPFRTLSVGILNGTPFNGVWLCCTHNEALTLLLHTLIGHRSSYATNNTQNQTTCRRFNCGAYMILARETRNTTLLQENVNLVGMQMSWPKSKLMAFTPNLTNHLQHDPPLKICNEDVQFVNSFTYIIGSLITNDVSSSHHNRSRFAKAASAIRLLSTFFLLASTPQLLPSCFLDLFYGRLLYMNCRRSNPSQVKSSKYTVNQMSPTG